MSLSLPHRLNLQTVLLTSAAILSAIAIPSTSVKVNALPVSENRSEEIAQQSILHVNPNTGSDAPTGGTEFAPLRSITYALQQASSGTVIQLAPGQYSAESFPLQLKSGVTLRGNDLQQGQGVVVYGGGEYVSRTFLRQNVAIVAANDSQISGITVTNPNLRGTGIWVESTNPTIRNSTFANNHREGIFVTGSGAAIVENNSFIENGGNGMSLAKNAGGEIRGNRFERTGYGIAVGGNATPLIANNQIRNNRSGVIATQSARPVLQGNAIEYNSQYGVVAMAQAQPIIDAGNIMTSNGQDRMLANNPAPVVSNPPVNTLPSVTATAPSGTSFSCLSQDGGYATVAKRGSATIPQPMITWSRAVGDRDAQTRCQEATGKLNTVVASNGGNLTNLVFTIGAADSGIGVCLIDATQATGCTASNSLFTLTGENANNPGEALRRLLTYSVTGSGSPVQETAGIPYATLTELEENLQPDEGLWFATEGE
ncbi:MAG: DUF1565 domain-containing protein [Cyanobacteriota bacterium]|nr:DUF1565 domain-containing protein [Cyanobacteriota bacterium]